jgi:DNA helicase TIP49 (TBP-interacting protein)
MPLKTMPESTAAALHDGIVLTQQDIDYSFDLIKNFTPSITSMLIDKGSVIELDAIVGSVKRSYQKQNLMFLTFVTFSKVLMMLFGKK